MLPVWGDDGRRRVAGIEVLLVEGCQWLRWKGEALPWEKMKENAKDRRNRCEWWGFEGECAGEVREVERKEKGVDRNREEEIDAARENDIEEVEIEIGRRTQE